MHLELFMVKNERLPLRVSAFLWNFMKDYTLIVKLVLDPGKAKNPEGVGDVDRAKSKRLFCDVSTIFENKY